MKFLLFFLGGVSHNFLLKPDIVCRIVIDIKVKMIYSQKSHLFCLLKLRVESILLLLELGLGLVIAVLNFIAPHALNSYNHGVLLSCIWSGAWMLEAFLSVLPLPPAYSIPSMLTLQISLSMFLPPPKEIECYSC